MIEPKDWITVAAILMGPILAVQAQRIVDRAREKRNQRRGVFHALMATRAARVSPQHVEALNRIDIEFYGRRVLGTQYQTRTERAVTNAWKNYSDHLNTAAASNEIVRWNEAGYLLFGKMLFEMSNALGYNFDEVQLRRNVYSPVAHGQREAQDAAIRDGFEKLLTNKSALTVVAIPAPPAQSASVPQETASPVLPQPVPMTTTSELSTEAKADQ